MIPRFLLCYCLTAGLGFPALRGQTPGVSLDTVALNQAIAVHDRLLKDQSGLLNGSVFVEYPYNFISGSPFMPPGHFRNGGVVYDGYSYDNIPLVYDDLKGDLIAGLTLNIRLVPEKIASFYIGDQRFVRLPASLVKKPEEFYQWLVQGNANLYKKVSKKLIIKRSKLGTEVYASVEESSAWLLLQDQELRPVDDKAALLSLLRDRKDQVKKFITDNHLELASGNYEYGLMKVIAFYNQLKQ